MTFTQVSKNTQFDQASSTNARNASSNYGSSIAIDGTTAIIGAGADDYNSTGGSVALSAGAAYVINYDGTNWNNTQKLVANDRAANVVFGGIFANGIAISGTTAAIGSAQNNTDATGGATLSIPGAVYVFNYNGSSWTQSQKIVASNRFNNGMFGKSIAIDGTRMLIGAFNNGSASGSAYFFNYNGSSWTQSQSTTSSVQSGAFGGDVALSGTWAAVTGVSISPSGTMLWIFRDNGSSWTQHQAIAAPSDGGNFASGSGANGHVIKITASESLIVGCPGATLNATGGSSLSAAGAVYVFNYNGSSWTQSQKIVANDRAASDQFGASLVVSGTNMIIGSPLNSTDATGGSTVANSGAIYHFVYNGSSWTQSEKFVPNVGSNVRNATDLFGNSVDISGTTVLAGAYLHDYDSAGASSITNSGAVFFLSNTAFAGTSYVNSRIVRLF